MNQIINKEGLLNSIEFVFGREQYAASTVPRKWLIQRINELSKDDPMEKVRSLRERLKAEQQLAYEHQMDIKEYPDHSVDPHREIEWCEGRIQGFNSALDAIRELFPELTDLTTGEKS